MEADILNGISKQRNENFAKGLAPVCIFGTSDSYRFQLEKFMQFKKKMFIICLALLTSQ